MAGPADGAAAVVASPPPVRHSDPDPATPGAGQPVMDLLRFAAIGSVDDGKSTLIGRLLHDTKQLFDDQIEAVEAASRRRGVEGIDLSFVTDGLRAEREQGITIDVAYRYAATPTRKFVIADCPGHVQYTRNMATGASTADLALVVVDAPKGLREQTRRHVCIAALLGVRHLIVAANKMDLIDWDESVYQRVVDEMAVLAERLGVESCTVIPVSALKGDNVAARSDAAPWYNGPTILDALEQAPAGEWAGAHGDRRGAGARLPVQWVLRQPGGGRTYAGMINGGPLRPGDEVAVLPGGQRSTVTGVETLDGPLAEAAVGLSVSVQLADDVDVSRGDLLAAADDLPEVVTQLVATVCWFDPRPLVAGAQYRIKHTTRVTPARIVSVDGRLDVNRLELLPAESLDENDIGTVTLAFATPLAVDPYRRNRITGSFVVIDPTTNGTVAAGMVGPPALTPLGQDPARLDAHG
ncbi:MAG TPA: GTP-binding protein [Acidimicrobiales bacterium]|nr:GTP-binding protein [Acidimicrobiales bacterium]